MRTPVRWSRERLNAPKRTEPCFSLSAHRAGGANTESISLHAAKPRTLSVPQHVETGMVLLEKVKRFKAARVRRASQHGVDSVKIISAGECRIEVRSISMTICSRVGPGGVAPASLGMRLRAGFGAVVRTGMCRKRRDMVFENIYCQQYPLQGRQFLSRNSFISR